MNSYLFPYWHQLFIHSMFFCSQMLVFFYGFLDDILLILPHIMHTNEDSDAFMGILLWFVGIAQINSLSLTFLHPLQVINKVMSHSWIPGLLIILYCEVCLSELYRKPTCFRHLLLWVGHKRRLFRPVPVFVLVTADL